jgi:hypothetical protein
MVAFSGEVPSSIVLKLNKKLQPRNTAVPQCSQVLRVKQNQLMQVEKQLALKMAAAQKPQT